MEQGETLAFANLIAERKVVPTPTAQLNVEDG